MNRAPGFMCYAQKAIAGSQHLSPEAFKPYWLMLFWMWANSKDYCSIPDTDIAWSIATQITDPDKLERVKAEIMNPLFPLLKKTSKKVYSNGLKKEAKKQQNTRQKNSIAGRASAKARRDKALEVQRMLNERSSQVEPKSNLTVTYTDTVTDTLKEKKEPSLEATLLSSFLLERIRETRPDFKKPNMDEWAKHADYMLRLDKRSQADCNTLIAWVHGFPHVGILEPHDFWSTNILSMKKFRAQFDQLKGQWRKEKDAQEHEARKQQEKQQREFSTIPCVVCGKPLGTAPGYAHESGGYAHTTQGDDGCYGGEARFDVDGTRRDST